MSEKFNNRQRKVILLKKGMSLKEGISLGIVLLETFIPIILLAITIFVALLIPHLVAISVCWNITMPTMFGFQKITIFQTVALQTAIRGLKTDFVASIKHTYENINSNLFNMIQKEANLNATPLDTLQTEKKEKLAKILSVILTTLLETLSILATVLFVMYSWNKILPNLLNLELCQIDFVQSFGFAFLFNCLFVTRKLEDKKPKSTENTTQTDEDITENSN